MLGFTALVGDARTYAAENTRRYIFYSQPTGAATLTGMLSLMDPEETDGPEFGWHEKRWTEKTALTADSSDGVSGPWTNLAGTALSGADRTLVVGSEYRVYVTVSTTIDNWRVGERIMIHRQLTSTADTYGSIWARITAVGSNYFNVVIITLNPTSFTVDNTHTTNEGFLITSLGTPHQEGSTLPQSMVPTYPIKPVNYTQIFRTVVGFTSTQLRQPMFFDEKGLYRSHTRERAIDHLIEIENACLFGQRSRNDFTGDDGSPTTTRCTGSIYWFLQEYEKAGGGSFGYRPGGAALTANTDDEKRIIQAPENGAITYALWHNTIEERMFRRCAADNEKLVLGGSGLISAIIEHYRGRDSVTINRTYDEMTKLSWGLHTITTDWGTLHLKSHPRFNDRAGLRYSGYVLDLPFLKWRPMVGRDTFKQTNVHENGFDGIKDAFLTEGGLEVRFPEAHMWLENVQSIATS